MKMTKGRFIFISIIALSLQLCFLAIVLQECYLVYWEYIGPESATIKLAKKKLATEHNSVISPSGRYLLRLVRVDVEEVRSYRFAVDELVNGESKRTVLEAGKFKASHTFFVLWDDEIDRVWTYEGDYGWIECWQVENGQGWSYHFGCDGKERPELLKKLRPGH